MKKLISALLILILILGGVFFWLLSGTGPDHAPSEEVTVNLPTKFKN